MRSLHLLLAFLALGAPARCLAQEQRLVVPLHVRPRPPQETLPVSKYTGLPLLEVSAMPPVAEIAAKSGAAWTEHEYRTDWFHFLRDDYADQLSRVPSDFRNMYASRETLGLGVAFLIAAPLANTDADRDIQAWYQKRGQGRTADRVSEAGKALGQHMYLVPVLVAGSLSGRLFPDDPSLGHVSEWSDRSIRALIVGSPAVGVLQVGLGSGRPVRDETSHWRPFRYKHAVAGHGFVGAVPFLTAATMVEHKALKTVLLAGSFWTTWSRVHDDAHYTSQAVLGWAIAYFAVQAVSHTECQQGRFSLVPVEIPGGGGVGMLLRY